MRVYFSVEGDVGHHVAGPCRQENPAGFLLQLLDYLINFKSVSVAITNVPVCAVTQGQSSPDLPGRGREG